MARQQIRIATRTSPLALWQAHYVQQQLQYFHPSLEISLLPIKTKGDKILDTPLAKIGGKGLFVKELEQQMLANHADIAVHSMKDIPVEFPEGLMLHTLCEREDPRDAFVSNRYKTLAELPKNSKVGTSSLRRQAQIRAAYPHLQVFDLRGNVNTRLAKLDTNEYDAIILASAGLIRLDLAARITQALPVEESLPANGQGAVGIECRTEDTLIHELLVPLQHQETTYCVLAERSVNAYLQGGCQVPIGAFAQLSGDQLWLRALVGLPDGSKILRAQAYGAPTDHHALGIQVAEALLAQGAEEILRSIR